MSLNRKSDVLGELLEVLADEVDLDLATSSDVDSLTSVLAVANVGAENADALQVRSVSNAVDIPLHSHSYLEDSEEDRGVQCGLAWKTDGHESGTWAEVVKGLSVARALQKKISDQGHRSHVRSTYVGSSDNGRVSTSTTSGGTNVLDDVLRLLEIDPDLGAEALAKLLLLSTSVDGDDPQATSAGVLNGQVAKSSSGTGKNNPITGVGLAVLDRTVDGNASTEDGGGSVGGEALGDGSDVVDVGDDVFSEGAVDGVAGKLAVGAV